VRRLALTLSRHFLSLSRFGTLLEVRAPLTLAAKRPFARHWLRFWTLKKAKKSCGDKALIHVASLRTGLYQGTVFCA
jgi:hypothetical protein